MTRRPIWSVSSVNDEALPEDTARDFEFDYVDISSVTTGAIAPDLQRITFREAPSRARRLARSGDVLVSTVRTYLRAVAPVETADYPRVYSTGFAVLRPDPRLMDPEFFKYALLATDFIDQITAHSNGVSYPAINPSELVRLRVSSPPLTEQRRIADYLDRETAEIGTMDAELDQLIDSLRRRRGATVALAVRLHPTQNLPSDWRRIPFKFAIAQRFTGEWGGEAGTDEVDVPCVRVADFDRVRRVAGETIPTVRSLRKDRACAKALRPGDLLLERSGGTPLNPVGNVVLYVGPAGAICSNFVECIRLAPDHDPAFWRYVQEASYATGFTSVHVRQTTGIQNLDAQGFYDEYFAVPTLSGQRAIAERLDEQTGRIDSMIADANRLKSLLTERRQTLITDVITGRKEIPTA